MHFYIKLGILKLDEACNLVGNCIDTRKGIHLFSCYLNETLALIFDIEDDLKTKTLESNK